MKKLAATMFVIACFGAIVFAQQPPTLTIVTETPGLPSELFYGSVKVKPVRLRPGTNTPITIDDYDFFIQQQYIDFLKRFPEAGADGIYGTADDPMKYYLDIINNFLNAAPCTPSDINCVATIRGVESANFFRSPEFQRKGNYVMYMYMVTIGHRPATAAELQTDNIDRPHYSEFLTDLASISTPNDDPTLTNQKKDALAQAFVNRAEIQALYPSGTYPTNTAFANALANTAGVTLTSQTQSAVSSASGRAAVLRIVAESPEVNAKFYHQSFVTMEYFGYLRRDPEDCHNSANYGGTGDPNQCGYIFHNNRFNLGFDPNDVENIIVRGFIESPEYRNRF